MNVSKSPNKAFLIRGILAFIIFAVELYLYVFVRNENILDLFVTIAAGILFIVFLTIYIMRSKNKGSVK